MNRFDVIIIGGGAAGLMCAITAGRRGRRVLIVDSSNKVGKKILMSGGGRCNFTNQFVEPDNFISENSHFCKSALSQYDQWQFINLVEQYDIAYHERKHGQLFCDISAKEILTMLLRECEKVEVKIVTDCLVESVNMSPQANFRFELMTNKGVHSSQSLVVATGGLSIPKMGASGFGYRIAEQFGLNVIPTRAGLVPLTFGDNTKALCERLSGVSIDCRISTNGSNKKISFDEALLFSHRGLTGPVALQISNYWREREAIEVDLLPETHIEELFADAKANRPKSLVRSLLGEHLPKSLITELEASLWENKNDLPVGEWSSADLDTLARTLSHWVLRPSGTQGYRTAEVTLGGVDTNEIASKTMECKKHSGLFFIGEVLDVTGHLGGFNFQWAWSSGYAAGSSV